MQLPLIYFQPYHTQIIYPHKAETLSNYQPGCHGLHQRGMKEMQSDVIKQGRKEFEILACSTWEAEFQASILWGSEKWRARSVLVLSVSKWLCQCFSTAHGARALYTSTSLQKTAVSTCMGLVSFPFAFSLPERKLLWWGEGSSDSLFRGSLTLLSEQKADRIAHEARWVVIFSLEIPTTASWRLHGREEIPDRSHRPMDTFHQLDLEVPF